MLSFLVAAALAQNGYSCAVMGSSGSVEPGKAVDYAGVRYSFCCPGCDQAFIKEPTKYTSEPKGALIGYSLFNVVDGSKIDFRKRSVLKASDYKGVRYYFANDEQVKQFKAEPSKFIAPEKEALFCPVMKEEVSSYAEAGGFVDVDGVRYYVCCPGCIGALKNDPAKYVESAKEAVSEPKALKTKEDTKK